MEQIILQDCAEEKYPQVAKEIISFSGKRKVFVFEGELGAGKTTLISYIAKELGVDEYTDSPTFSLINEYKRKNGSSVFHIDFYRLNNISEATDIGIKEYLDSSDYCLIEWGTKFMELLPSDCVYVRIEINKLNSNRNIVIKSE